MLLALALSASAEEVISTCEGRTGEQWGGIAVQHFTVPYGCTASKVEFRCDTSRARHLPEHTLVVQVYSESRQHLATNGAPAKQFSEAPGWLAVEGLSLAPGKYYAQMFSNSEALQPLIRAYLVTDSGYRGGHAATGWEGGAPLAEDTDFEVRVTVTRAAPPEVQLVSAPGFLIKDGAPACAIVVADDSGPAEWTAAEELREHLCTMSGAQLPILQAKGCPKVPAIAVGFNASLPPPLQPCAFGRLDEQELVIKPDGDTLLLAGGSPCGTLYAVYELLHRLGVRWYSPKYTAMPWARDIAMPQETVQYSPPVTNRTLAAGIEQDPVWMARNRLTTIAHWGALGSALGRPGHEGPDMHTVWRMVSPETIREHPDWAAEVDGKRVETVNLNTWDLCYTNPEARAYLIQRTIDWARENPDCKTVWIGQNDSPMYCTCPRCKAFYEAHGGKPSSVIVQLANELADALVANGMPDRTAKTLAYGWSREPPTGMLVRDNAAIMACDARQVTAWRKIARNVCVYLYGSSEAYWIPLPTVYPDAEALKAAARDGAGGLYRQISGFGGTIGSDMVNLRTWLDARAMWDPTADLDALVHDFCVGYYGPAAAAVEESLRIRHEQFIAEPQAAAQSPIVPACIAPAPLRRINELLEAAYNALPDGDYKTHLGAAWISYLWADFWLGYRGAGSYDAQTGTWSVAMADGEVRNRYGALARRLMVESGVTALSDQNRLAPQELALDKMGVAWPAHLLREGALQAVVVPGVGGMIGELRDTARDFSPLKPMWGGLANRYPLFSCTGESLGGVPVREYEVAGSSSSEVRLTSALETCGLQKTVRLAEGKLQVELAATGRNGAEVAPCAEVMFDLLAPGLGTHPTVSIRKQDGTFTHRKMGAETDFWWVEGPLDIAGATGTMVIASESRPDGVELTFDPAQLSSIDFWYDNLMNHYPTPEQHGMLRLFLRAGKGAEAKVNYSLRLLPDASARLRGMEQGGEG